jgi:hypothetical protein
MPRHQIIKVKSVTLYSYNYQISGSPALYIKMPSLLISLHFANIFLYSCTILTCCEELNIQCDNKIYSGIAATDCHQEIIAWMLNIGTKIKIRTSDK